MGTRVLVPVRVSQSIWAKPTRRPKQQQKTFDALFTSTPVVIWWGLSDRIMLLDPEGQSDTMHVHVHLWVQVPDRTALN